MPPEFPAPAGRSEEHTSELQSHLNLGCRLLLEKKNKNAGRPRIDHRAVRHDDFQRSEASFVHLHVAVDEAADFFFNDTATTEIYTLSLHDALPICWPTEPSDDQPSSPAADSTALRSKVTRRASRFKAVESSLSAEDGSITAAGSAAGAAGSFTSLADPRVLRRDLAAAFTGFSDSSASGAVPRFSRYKKREQAFTKGIGVFLAPKPKTCAPLALRCITSGVKSLSEE